MIGKVYSLAREDCDIAIPYLTFISYYLHFMRMTPRCWSPMSSSEEGKVLGPQLKSP